jgi:hypothetical protein
VNSKGVLGSRLIVLATALVLRTTLPCGQTACAAELSATSRTDYLEPKVLTGTIYSDSSLRKVLFTFRRTATNSGPTIRVLREYFLPGGALAAREHVVYEAGRLISFKLDELQSGEKGEVVSRPDPKDSGARKLVFEYTLSPSGKKRADAEQLQPDTLVNDMVAPFMFTHWNEIANGATVRCRYMVLARTQTVGLSVSKQSETTWRGKPVVRVKVEPTSIIIAQFIDPLYFTVEKEGAHRILNYSGRITPLVQRKGDWEDLDAFTVFDWK